MGRQRRVYSQHSVGHQTELTLGVVPVRIATLSAWDPRMGIHFQREEGTIIHHRLEISMLKNNDAALRNLAIWAVVVDTGTAVASIPDPSLPTGVDHDFFQDFLYVKNFTFLSGNDIQQSVVGDPYNVDSHSQRMLNDDQEIAVVGRVFEAASDVGLIGLVTQQWYKLERDTT